MFCIRAKCATISSFFSAYLELVIWGGVQQGFRESSTPTIPELPPLEVPGAPAGAPGLDLQAPAPVGHLHESWKAIESSGMHICLGWVCAFVGAGWGTGLELYLQVGREMSSKLVSHPKLWRTMRAMERLSLQESRKKTTPDY